MILIAITLAAYDATCSTLPEDAPLRPLIHIEAAVLNRLRAMRRPGRESRPPNLTDGVRFL